MENVNQNNLDSENIGKYIKDVQAIPDLTVEEEKELFEKIAKKEDKEAVEKITKANLKLVILIAEGWVNRNPKLNLADLVKEGNYGLLKAIRKFDLKKTESAKYTFQKYATWWIREAITRKITRDYGLDIRVSRK
jgi:RNA polymerase primary sigma factor